MAFTKKICSHAVNVLAAVREKERVTEERESENV